MTNKKLSEKEKDARLEKASDMLQDGYIIMSSGVKTDKSYGLLGSSSIKKRFTGGNEIGIKASQTGSKYVPEIAFEIVNQVKSINGVPPKGYKGGRVFQNDARGGGQKLPDGVIYKEYDINPFKQGQNRGKERIVIGDDGSVWYTNDHYTTFIKIK